MLRHDGPVQRALAERFPALRVSGRPVRRNLQALRGFEYLPVTLR